MPAPEPGPSDPPLLGPSEPDVRSGDVGLPSESKTGPSLP